MGLIVLNTLVNRTIEQHLQNLEENLEGGPMVNTNQTQRERSLRKREVALSRINIFIVYIIVTCHTIRRSQMPGKSDKG